MMKEVGGRDGKLEHSPRNPPQAKLAKPEAAHQIKTSILGLLSGPRKLQFPKSSGVLVKWGNVKNAVHSSYVF